MLFFANYKRYLNLFKRTLPRLKVEKALAAIANIKKTYNKMQDKIKNV